MALQTASLTYSPACDMPDCIVVGKAVAMFLRDDVETTTNLPYLTGTVTVVTLDEDADTNTVTVQYNDNILPVGFIFTFPSEGVVGTVCPPDCIGECDWLGKALRVVGQEITPPDDSPFVIQYRLFNQDEPLENRGAPLNERMPLGFRLTHVTLTFDELDVSTTFDYRLEGYRGEQVIGNYVLHTSGSGNGGAGIVIDITATDGTELISFDELVFLNLSAVTPGGMYVEVKGLVITLMGTL